MHKKQFPENIIQLDSNVNATIQYRTKGLMIMANLSLVVQLSWEWFNSSMIVHDQ